MAAVLAACVAGVSGAVGASAGARAAGNAAQRQAEYDHDLQVRQAAVRDIETVCGAYHEKGMAALLSVYDFQTAICGGGDGAGEEAVFVQSFRILMMATFDVGRCSFVLEEPAARWYEAIQRIANTLRALRADLTAAADPGSPGRQQLVAVWTEHRAAFHAFSTRVHEAKKQAAARSEG